MGQTIQNLKDGSGEDYFNEALFSAIEKSDSAKRSKMYGKLLVLSAKDEKVKASFWEILNVLQTLLMSDLENIPSLIKHNEIEFGSGGAASNARQWGIGHSQERRFRAVGIFVDEMSMQGEPRDAFDFCKAVLKCVE